MAAARSGAQRPADTRCCRRAAPDSVTAGPDSWRYSTAAPIWAAVHTGHSRRSGNPGTPAPGNRGRRRFGRADGAKLARNFLAQVEAGRQLGRGRAGDQPAQAGAHPEKSALAIRNGGMSVPIIPVRDQVRRPLSTPVDFAFVVTETAAGSPDLHGLRAAGQRAGARAWRFRSPSCVRDELACLRLRATNTRGAEQHGSRAGPVDHSRPLSGRNVTLRGARRP